MYWDVQFQSAPHSRAGGIKTSTLPLLPAKQRLLQSNDWMSTDTRVVCPDPLCGTVMRIDRTERRVLHHGDVSAVPL